MTSDLSVPAPQPNPSAALDLDEIEADFADPGVVGLRKLGTVGTGPLCRLVAAVPDLVAEVRRLRETLAMANYACEQANRLTAGQKKLTDKAAAERDAARAEAERQRERADHNAAAVNENADEIVRLRAEAARVREALAEMTETLERITTERNAFRDERNAARAEAERLEAECDSFARMYARAVERYDDLGMGVMQKIADRCSLTDVLNFVGDQLNECDNADDESIALWKRAAGVAAEAGRVREALQAVSERAKAEIADAKEGEHYHAEVNNAAGLAAEQSRRSAWESVVRALDAALDGETND